MKRTSNRNCIIFETAYLSRLSAERKLRLHIVSSCVSWLVMKTMTLREYLKHRKITLEDFADAVGYSKSAVAKWSSGHGRPGSRAVASIYAATSGCVDANSLLGLK